jgi:hypothetical protein
LGIGLLIGIGLAREELELIEHKPRKYILNRIEFAYAYGMIGVI